MKFKLRRDRGLTPARRRLTAREQALAEEIIRAWVDPGISPSYHARHQNIVRAQMPTLGKALDDMAREYRR